MPQLNPAPWFMTLVMTWTILALVMKLTLTNIPNTQQPHQTNKPTTTPHWPWTWQ
uniref:ATP synthase complex subunit 8 n=1 Tax=Cyrtodactylus tigroides TaxID=1234048 RepID=A0A3G9DMG8_9SAUR|nr:ATP synthase F0 subunit 8 [Cyrtodactylus tigroides]